MSQSAYRPCVGITLFNRGRAWSFIGRRRSKRAVDPAGRRATSGRCRRAASMPGRLPAGRGAAGTARGDRRVVGVVHGRGAAVAHLRPARPTCRAGAGKAATGARSRSWFAFRFEGDEREINIDQPEHGLKPEFDAWRWERIERLPGAHHPVQAPGLRERGRELHAVRGGLILGAMRAGGSASRPPGPASTFRPRCGTVRGSCRPPIEGVTPCSVRLERRRPGLPWRRCCSSRAPFRRRRRTAVTLDPQPLPPLADPARSRGWPAKQVFGRALDAGQPPGPLDRLLRQGLPRREPRALPIDGRDLAGDAPVAEPELGQPQAHRGARTLSQGALPAINGLAGSAGRRHLAAARRTDDHRPRLAPGRPRRRHLAVADAGPTWSRPEERELDVGHPTWSGRTGSTSTTPNGPLII